MDGHDKARHRPPRRGFDVCVRKWYGDTHREYDEGESLDFTHLFANYWTGFEREYRETGSVMADMLAWSLFWYLLHISPLFIGGFIVKKGHPFRYVLVSK